MAFKSRQFTPQDIAAATEMMVKENWYVSNNMTKAAYYQDPKGCVTAVDDKGNIIGFILTNMFADTIGYVVALMVRLDWRGKGVGKFLLQKSLDYAGKSNLSLMSIDHAIKFYQAKGFQHTSFTMDTYKGKVDKSKLYPSSATGDVSILEYSEEMLDEICRYDQKIHILPHREFLKIWMDRDHGTSFVAVSKSTGIVGYATVQQLGQGDCCVGPLFADNDDIAKALWSKVMSIVPQDKNIIFNGIKEHHFVKDMVREHNLEEEVNTTRLYTKNIMEFPLGKVYAMGVGTLV